MLPMKMQIEVDSIQAEPSALPAADSRAPQDGTVNAQPPGG